MDRAVAEDENVPPDCRTKLSPARKTRWLLRVDPTAEAGRWAERDFEFHPFRAHRMNSAQVFAAACNSSFDQFEPIDSSAYINNKYFMNLVSIGKGKLANPIAIEERVYHLRETFSGSAR